MDDVTRLELQHKLIHLLWDAACEDAEATPGSSYIKLGEQLRSHRRNAMPPLRRLVADRIAAQERRT